MFSRADGAVHSQVQRPPQTTVRRSGRKNLWHKLVKAFNRKVEEVDTSRFTQSQATTINAKDLSSRKVLWLKLKYNLKLYTCRIRLALHLHFGSESRVELKKSRDISKAQLEALKCKDSRQSETEKLQEAIEDGQPGDVIRSVANIGRAAIGEGGNRVREWWLKI
ncbi:hypothetical protein [Endozoicomonas elysicola]|uniref:Uncharacterized protein n=1 Tax=Endozoicomonas elysicola TaxID=305900 RepID=A0A081K7F5_9GAMM|nr:hypothetical protein [Endozoicomonas elysicola]KEI70081.1 hypothetical protein GV64_04370 [Endozoicomonas elysicola]